MLLACYSLLEQWARALNFLYTLGLLMQWRVPPVSALIHAATMVTAGVYLVIRANPLYSIIPEVGLAIACLGAFVAVFAATMALVNKDLKRIIAYSTLSQLGYMFVAAGLEAYWIALFHLATHAFLNPCYFWGQGM